MIELSGINGERHLLHRNAIARVTEAGASGQWHGICAYVKLFDGHTLEVRETVDAIRAEIEERS